MSRWYAVWIAYVDANEKADFIGLVFGVGQRGVVGSAKGCEEGRVIIHGSVGCKQATTGIEIVFVGCQG